MKRGRRRPHEGNDASGLPCEPWGFFCWTNGMEIRPMSTEDWPAVKAIYEQGIATKNATFDIEAPTWEDWDAGHLTGPRLVAERDGAIVAWAALSPTSSRAAYAGVVENSIYVDETARGQGIGRELLGALVAQADATGIWTVQTSIFAENTASLALHRACGFRVVGVRERI